MVSDALGQAAISSGLIDATGSIDPTATLGRTGKNKQRVGKLMGEQIKRSVLSPRSHEDLEQQQN